MATYYADLDLTGTGGAGTVGDPWRADTFQIQVYGVLNAGDIIKVRGSHNWVGESNETINIYGTGDTNITVENWGTNIWRVSSASFSVLHQSSIKYGIINCTSNFFNTNGNVLGCFIMAPTAYMDSTFGAGIIVIKGSTLVIEKFETLCATNADFTDCIIDCNDLTSFDGVGSDRCCWTIDVIPGIGVHTNAQTYWTPPVWPAWNDTQSAFTESLLYAGITTLPQPGNSPYTGYEKGLWDTTRNGIGAMYFESPGSTTTLPPHVTYYADLDLTGTGGDGTEGNPWHADTFQSQLNTPLLASGSVVKVRGSHEWLGTADDNIFVQGIGVTPITVRNWGIDTWRISCVSFRVYAGSTIKNGIIKNSSVSSGLSLYSAIVYNCFIIQETVTFKSGPCVLKGCTLITNTISAGTIISDIDVNLTDCIIDCLDITYFNGVDSDNCCWTIATIPGTGVHTDAQTGWNPPSWPAWNASKSFFNSKLLYIGITTPPHPGNNPYVMYKKGLWESYRIGIGSMLFNSPYRTHTVTVVDGVITNWSYSDSTPTPFPDPPNTHTIVMEDGLIKSWDISSGGVKVNQTNAVNIVKGLVKSWGVVKSSWDVVPIAGDELSWDVS